MEVFTFRYKISLLLVFFYCDGIIKNQIGRLSEANVLKILYNTSLFPVHKIQG